MKLFIHNPPKMTNQKQVLIEKIMKEKKERLSDPRAYGFNIDMTSGYCQALDFCKQILQDTLPEDKEGDVVEIKPQMFCSECGCIHCMCAVDKC